MGPFPHDAPRATITPENPAGTDGFEFVEFAHPEPEAARSLRADGLHPHRHPQDEGRRALAAGRYHLCPECRARQFAARFVEEHGPCAPSMAWRVVDAKHAFEHAISMGAEPYEGDDKTLDWPAIKGIGGSLIYFTDQYYDTSPYNEEFDWVSNAHPRGWGSTTSTT
jgi:4-hydroxyphenylpyruvate dioxygenase